MSFGCVRSKTLVLLALIAIVICSLSFHFYFSTWYRKSHHDKACADFNYGAKAAQAAGLLDPYICPRDGISQLVCDESYPLKNLDSITQSNLNWNDIVIFVLIGDVKKIDPFRWWIANTNFPIDIVLVGDVCNNETIYATPSCQDPLQDLLHQLRTTSQPQRFHLVRAFAHDFGYKYLSCKLRTGAKLIYDMFPNKKYYFKVDADTILLPKRLLHFLQTLDSITNSDLQPLYFGTTIETGIDLLLCGRHWKKNGAVEKGGLCYAQGGAGYGLNNKAMSVLAESPQCNPKKLDASPEDTYTGLRIYEFYKSNVIHCGGFVSSGLMSEVRLRKGITFHHVDSVWLKRYGETLKHYT